MQKLSKSFILEFVLALIFVLPLHAQTATSAPADANATAANPRPSSQAPDEATRKIAELVHDGNYVEAQQLTTGLLVAYPNDQRLVKAKALIEKLLSPAGSANAIPNNNQPTDNAAPVRPSANTSAEQLSGMDKVEYNTLIELARQAQQGTDTAQQRALLKQFMDQSSVFLQKYPDQMLLWKFRVVSALSLDDPMAGYDAGQKLLAAGAADSNDPNLQRLLAQLNSKGWLDKQKAEDDKKYEGLLGTWKVSLSTNGVLDQDGYKEVFAKSASGNIEGYFMFKNAGHRESIPNIRGIIHASGDTSWEMYLIKISTKNGKDLDPEWPGGRYFAVNDAPGRRLYPSGWQPPISSALSDDKRTMTMKFPLQTPNIKRDSRFVSEHPVTWVFEKISDSEDP